MKLDNMHYLIYKTTNKINGKFYIGAHCSNNLHDHYLGSGIHIKKAIKKYGKKNFIRETLQFANSQKELYELERQIVNEDLINNPLSYNKSLGGFGASPGSFHFQYQKERSIETKVKISTTLSGRKRKIHSLVMKEKYKNGEIIMPISGRFTKGMKRASEHQNKLTAKIKERVLMCCIHCKHTRHGIWLCHLNHHHKNCNAQ